MPILIVRKDGGVSIMYSDDEKELDKWKDFHADEYVSHRYIKASDIPTDRSNRNEWNSDTF